MDKGMLIVLGVSLLAILTSVFLFSPSAQATAPIGSVDLSQGQNGGQPATSSTPQPTVNAGGSAGVQEVRIKALGTGFYDNQVVTVKPGRVRLYFSAEPSSGCGRAFMLNAFGVRLVSRNGETQTAEFDATTPGEYEYSCSMRMFRGKLRVVA